MIKYQENLDHQASFSALWKKLKDLEGICYYTYSEMFCQTGAWIF